MKSGAVPSVTSPLELAAQLLYSHGHRAQAATVREAARLLTAVTYHPIACDRWTCGENGDDYNEDKHCTCEVGAFMEPK